MLERTAAISVFLRMRRESANPHALAFYESVGFIEDGTAETSGGPAVRMHRDS